MKTTANNIQNETSNARNNEQVNNNAVLSELTPATDEIANKIGLTVEHMTSWGARNFYYYRDENGENIKNAKGEHIIIEISHVDDSGCKNSLPSIWFKEGYTKELLQKWWSIHIYVENENGDCYMAYNPQTKLSQDRKRYEVNFKWTLSATAKNFEKLLSETLRRFNAAK